MADELATSLIFVTRPEGPAGCGNTRRAIEHPRPWSGPHAGACRAFDVDKSTVDAGTAQCQERHVADRSSLFIHACRRLSPFIHAHGAERRRANARNGAGTRRRRPRFIRRRHPPPDSRRPRRPLGAHSQRAGNHHRRHVRSARARGRRIHRHRVSAWLRRFRPDRHGAGSCPAHCHALARACVGAGRGRVRVAPGRTPRNAEHAR